MNLQRITRIQVLIVGLALFAGVAALFLLVLVKPRMSSIKTIIAAAEENEAIAATRRTRENELADAQVQEQDITDAYDDILDNRMPDIDLSDPFGATFRMQDLPAEEEEIISRWFRDTGAVVTGYGYQDWPVGMPDAFPDPNMQILPRLDWNLTVQVKGFPELLRFLETFPKAPRFMVMQSVTIQGSHSPDEPIVATIPVTLYMWTGVPPTAVAAAPGAAAAGPVRGGPQRGMRRGRGPGGPGGMR